MRRLNILIIAEAFFPDRAGGAGRVVFELGKRLRKKGHNVYILARMFKNNSLSEEDVDGIKVYRYQANSKNMVIYFISSLINSLRAFNRLKKDISFDIINLHQPLGGLGIIFSGGTRAVSKIYTFHSIWFKEYEIKTGKKTIASLVMRLIEKLVLFRSQKVIALSEYSKKELECVHNLPSGKIEIIPGGVDIEKFKPADDKIKVRNDLGIPPDKTILFTVRNLVPRMGLENLIFSMAYVAKARKEAMLIIGGEGMLENKLKRTARGLGLENFIKFTGLIEEEMLPLYYQAADIFILPTEYLEGFGLVTLEALASGIPVLGTPVGGTRELLNKLDRSLIFSGIDPRSISDSVLKFIESKEKRSPAEEFRNFAVKYSWDEAASKTENKFYKAIK